MFNTYCSTTVTMVTRTCLSVTLYVHTLPGLSFLTEVLYGLAQKSSPISKTVVGKYEFWAANVTNGKNFDTQSRERERESVSVCVCVCVCVEGGWFYEFDSSNSNHSSVENHLHFINELRRTRSWFRSSHSLRFSTNSPYFIEPTGSPMLHKGLPLGPFVNQATLMCAVTSYF